MSEPLIYGLMLSPIGYLIGWYGSIYLHGVWARYRHKKHLAYLKANDLDRLFEKYDYLPWVIRTLRRGR